MWVGRYWSVNMWSSIQRKDWRDGGRERGREGGRKGGRKGEGWGGKEEKGERLMRSDVSIRSCISAQQCVGVEVNGQGIDASRAALPIRGTAPQSVQNMYVVWHVTYIQCKQETHTHATQQ